MEKYGHAQTPWSGFSRSQAQRIYVQDIVREQADELISWLDQGAVIYVCGSIDGMASGVDQALTDILGEEKVDALRQAGRYRPGCLLTRSSLSSKNNGCFHTRFLYNSIKICLSPKFAYT